MLQPRHTDKRRVDVSNTAINGRFDRSPFVVIIIVVIVGVGRVLERIALLLRCDRVRPEEKEQGESAHVFRVFFRSEVRGRAHATIVEVAAAIKQTRNNISDDSSVLRGDEISVAKFPIIQTASCI